MDAWLALQNTVLRQHGAPQEWGPSAFERELRSRPWWHAGCLLFAQLPPQLAPVGCVAIRVAGTPTDPNAGIRVAGTPTDKIRLATRVAGAGTPTDPNEIRLAGTPTDPNGGTLGAEDARTRWAELRWLAVKPEMRRRGVASRLLDAAQETARAAGCHGLRAEALRSRADAVGFYRALGFTERAMS